MVPSFDVYKSKLAVDIYHDKGYYFFMVKSPFI